MILHINACVRKNSRTKELADHLISRLGGDVKEVGLENIDFPKITEEYLIYRDKLVEEGRLSDPAFYLAREFAAANEIVVSAPYWDLSFPSALKKYFEVINVPHITFSYGSDGRAHGECRAKKLYYVTTAGGSIVEEFGYGYVKALANGLYGIKETFLVKAEWLDVDGADVEKILSEAKKRIDEIVP